MDTEIDSFFVDRTTALLNDLPEVDSFLGILDLKTGSMIISAISVLHPTIYGCTFFMPMTYLLLTIWFLLALFFIFSVLLFYGLTNNDVILISTWIWYSLLFVATMFFLMFLLALFFISKKENFKVFIVVIGILWYMLTIYFILVVNSHRKVLMEDTDTKLPDTTESTDVTKSSELTSLDDSTEKQETTIDASYSENDKDTVKDSDRLKAFRKASGINKRRP